MSTLDDLATAIDNSAEQLAPPASSLQSLITNALAKISNLSVSELNQLILGEASGQEVIELLAAEIRLLLIIKLKIKLLQKIVSSITPARTILVTAGQPQSK